MGEMIKMTVYNDGEYYVGKICQKNPHRYSTNHEQPDAMKKKMRLAFRSAYNEATEKHITKENQRKQYIQERFPELLEADGTDAGFDALSMYDDNIYDEYEKDTVHMMYLRKKRFRRKANLNEWNYFVTITYSDEKMTAEEFVSAIRKTFSNFHTRYNWNYCAVFEKGSEGDRIHLHAMVYIPDGQLNGEFFMRKQWSTKRNKMEFCNDHSYFHDRFGNCDFQRIDGQNHGRMVNYISKYLTKTDTKLIYSRGVPEEFKNIEIDRDIIFRFIPTQTGYLAILACSSLGMIDEEIKEGYFDYGDISDWRDRIYVPTPTIV